MPRLSLPKSPPLALLIAAALAFCQSLLPACQAQPAAPAPKPGVAALNPNYWGAFTPANDPVVIGKRLIENYVARPAPRPWGQGSSQAGAWYGEACNEFGGLRFAEQIQDKTLADKVVLRYANIITPQGSGIIPPADHVDRSVFGIIPFEIYNYNQNKAFLAIGKASADQQWSTLSTAPGRTALGDAAAKLGLSYQTRYWVDDMYMITSLQVQAYRMTKDKVYLDRAAKEVVAYIERLQQPNGLFFHGDGSPFFWGRGNGWFAVGMAELLSELPVDHPDYAKVMEGYKKMMAGLLKNQDADGMWNQLIDKPEAWKETSGTGMFTFAFAMGVRSGWLPEKEYKEPAKKAWTALCTYIDDKANVKEVCAGTNKGTSEAYYLARQRVVGDLHGQAGAIWAAWAMLHVPTPATAPAPK